MLEYIAQNTFYTNIIKVTYLRKAFTLPHYNQNKNVHTLKVYCCQEEKVNVVGDP